MQNRLFSSNVLRFVEGFCVVKCLKGERRVFLIRVSGFCVCVGQLKFFCVLKVALILKNEALFIGFCSSNRRRQACICPKLVVFLGILNFAEHLTHMLWYIVFPENIFLSQFSYMHSHIWKNWTLWVYELISLLTVCRAYICLCVCIVVDVQVESS